MSTTPPPVAAAPVAAAPAAAAPPPTAADDLLRHFPAEVRQAYTRLRDTGDPAAADTLVIAIVADFMPHKEMPLADTQALIADLGFDSVALSEVIFFLEDLLQVSVTNAEILRVRTIGDLRAFVRAKLAAQAAAPATALRA